MPELEFDLGEIAKEEEKKNSDKVSQKTKKRVKRTKNIDPNQILQQLSAQKLDPNLAAAHHLRYDKRVQVYANIPETIKTMIESKALDLGFEQKNGTMNFKAFLYYLLRKEGLEIPDDSLLDARVKK